MIFKKCVIIQKPYQEPDKTADVLDSGRKCKGESDSLTLEESAPLWAPATCRDAHLPCKLCI